MIKKDWLPRDAGGTSERQRASTIHVQRAWRGVLARRVFSDLFFEAVEAEIL